MFLSADDSENFVTTSKKQETFAAFLHRRGLNLTPERKAVLQEVVAGQKHFQADELYLRLARRKKSSPVSRATVFRTLKLLSESGLIRKVAFIDRHSHYEHTFGHDHLICSKCGRIIEFTDQSLAQSLARVCKAKNFSPLSHKVEVVGLCSKCS